jgi:hypothetical protein
MTTTVAFKLGGTLEILTEPSKAGCFVTVRHGNFTIRARGNDMAYTLAVDTQVQVKVDYVDGAGNPAKVDGDVRWNSSDDTIATVTVDPEDSFNALVRAAGKLGQVQITAIADADLGEGARPLVTPMDVECVAGEAVAGTITPVGSAEPIPHVEHHK